MQKRNYRQGCNVLIDLIQENDVAPARCDFYRVVGQSSVKNKLEFFLKSNKSDIAMPTFLFTGSRGLGKTYMAETVARCLSRRFIEVNCQTIETTKDLVEKVLLDKVLGKTPVTLLLDESHRLNNSITTILLTLLSPNKENKNTLEYRDCGIVFDLTKINVIFATTDSYKMFPALVNRCESIYFNCYNNTELIEMLQMYLPAITLKANKEDMSYCCRGRARDTYQLAQKIKRHCDSNNISCVDPSDWKYIKNIFEYHDLGLYNQELELVKIVGEAGIMALGSIAMKMRVSEDTLEAEIEPRLRELGLLVSTSRGRQLTKEGVDYYNNIPKV